MSRIHVLVLSGGTGTRMGEEMPKQFLMLGGLPILAHSIQVFIEWLLTPSIVVTAPEGYLDHSTSILREALAIAPDRIRSAETVSSIEADNDSGASILVIPGGNTRHDSTLRGLAAMQPRLKADDVVFIHDAARPLIARTELDRLAEAVYERGQEVVSLASPLSETIVQAPELPGPIVRTVDRSEYRTIQTPQGARWSILQKLMSLSAPGSAFTDLLTWAEAGGIQGHLVEAGPENVKLTHPRDLTILEQLYRLRDKPT